MSDMPDKIYVRESPSGILHVWKDRTFGEGQEYVRADILADLIERQKQDDQIATAAIKYFQDRSVPAMAEKERTRALETINFFIAEYEKEDLSGISTALYKALKTSRTALSKPEIK